jgi:acyl homoserine lactone synthase
VQRGILSGAAIAVFVTVASWRRFHTVRTCSDVLWALAAKLITQKKPEGMVVVSIGSRSQLTPEVITSMHDFRREILVRTLGWSLPLIDGIERDQYDNDDAVYFVAQDAAKQVTACARLLPTISHCILSDLFGNILASASAPRDQAIWELSRFAANVRQSHEGRVLSLSQPTLDLLDSILEFAQRHSVRRLALVTTIAVERLLIRARNNVHRIAAPVLGGLYVPLFIDVSRHATDVDVGNSMEASRVPCWNQQIRSAGPEAVQSQ